MVVVPPLPMIFAANPAQQGNEANITVQRNSAGQEKRNRGVLLTAGQQPGTDD